jgi:DUF4097 and DUF4098 domain-containing protein YvlB
MASPVMTPPRARRSMAGPVILIILGVVFLMGTMGVLRWSGLGHIFARFWPLLLILGGAIKIWEHQQAQREGTRAPGIGAGSIFLVIAIVIFGLMATQASHVDWGSLRDQINIDDNDFPLFGKGYSYDDSMAQAFPAGASLKVVNDHGAVTINTSDDNQLSVTIHKKVRADDQKNADQYNSQTKPQINVSGNVLTINANTSAAGDHSVNTDLEITVPTAAAVEVASKHGDVNVTGRKANVTISGQHGEIVVEDNTGNVSFNVDHNSVRAEKVTGDVSVDGRADDVSIIDVKGAARLNGEFMESVKLSKITKTVTFKSSRTDMEFSRMDGDLDLDSGDLRAGGVFGPVRLLTRSKDIRLEDVTGDVRLQDENAPVELIIASLGNIQIQNRRGDVSITIPPKASFAINAQTRGEGDIQSEFDELKVDSEHDLKTASGTVGSGGPHIVISTEHGSIEIRRGNGVSAPPVPPAPGKPSKSPRPPKAGAAPEPTEN